ncbi:MAG: hypothetical protein ACYS6W_18280, partial [Planctomycetota bacterium]
AYDLVNSGKGNPYVITQDWPKFFDTQKKIEANPNSVSDMEINQGTGKYWTYNQRQQLMNIKYPKQQDAVLRTPFASEWLKQIDLMYMEEGTTDIRRDDIPEWSGLREQVADVLRKYPGDYKKAQTEIEALMNPPKKKRAKSLLVDFWKAKYTGLLGRKLVQTLFGKETKEAETDIRQMSDEELRRIAGGQ